MLLMVQTWYKYFKKKNKLINIVKIIVGHIDQNIAIFLYKFRS